MNKENYETAIEELFKRWEERNKVLGFQKENFLRDGIINFEKWIQAKFRILFLNREFPLNRLLEKHPKLKDHSNFNNNIAYYYDNFCGEWTNTVWPQAYLAYAIHHFDFKNNLCPKFPPDTNLVIEAMRSCAIINVRKSDGKKTTNYDELSKHASQDREFLLEEIELLKPHLIIGGGTYDAVKNVLPINAKCANETDFHLIENGALFPFFNHYHPTYSVYKKGQSEWYFNYFCDHISKVGGLKIVLNLSNE